LISRSIGQAHRTSLLASHEQVKYSYSGTQAALTTPWNPTPRVTTDASPVSEILILFNAQECLQRSWAG
jgi:hypothetical protein